VQLPARDERAGSLQCTVLVDAVAWLAPLLSRELQSSPVRGLARSRHSYPDLCLWALSEGSSRRCEAVSQRLLGCGGPGMATTAPPVMTVIPSVPHGRGKVARSSGS